MIVFEPNTDQPMKLTRDQLQRVVTLTAIDNRARVVERENPRYVEVYVGEYAHETVRHGIDLEGNVLLTEYDPTDTGDWR